MRRCLTISSSSASCASRGALAGGFSVDNLEAWANRTWGLPKTSRKKKHYVDLISHKVTPGCASRLEQHPSPSSEVARAFFSSNVFAPERILVSSVGLSENNELPLTFQKGTSYLFFTATVATPHELILTWKLGSSRGFTMLAADPRTRLVYLGSGVEYSKHQDGLFFSRILTPFHVLYSNLLLKGMVQELENKTP